MSRTMDIKNQFGITFRARIVRKGERHGLQDCLIYDKDEPKVEFYDTRYQHVPDLGQYVAEYYIKTLLERNEYPKGLTLDLGIPSWRLSQQNMKEVRKWIKKEIESLSTEKEIKPYRLKGLNGKKVFYVDEQNNEIKKVLLFNNNEEEGSPSYVRIEIEGENGPVGTEHIYATKEEAEVELRKRRNDFKEKVKEAGIIETLYETWANEYPYGRDKMDRDVMKEIIKKEFGIEIK